MSIDVAIAPGEIQVVLNQFANGRLEVSSPLHGIEVATLEAREDGYRFHRIAGPEAFEDPAVEAWGADLGEAPRYSDLIDAFLYAGIARYSNIDAFQEKRRLLQTALSGEALFALDTNLFYHGFPQASGIPAEDLVIPEIVAAEIKHGLNWKYDAGKIAALKRVTPAGTRSLLDEFQNQRTKQARRATHFALDQYIRIRDDARQVPCGPGSSDKEANDALIVRAVRALQVERSGLVMMLTADQNLATLCDAEGVQRFLFVFPRDDPPRSAGFGEVLRWLYALAAVWGVVKVNSVLLFSEWRGRTDQRYPVRARFLNETMANGCIRDLQLCRELGSLGIER